MMNRLFAASLLFLVACASSPTKPGEATVVRRWDDRTVTFRVLGVESASVEVPPGEPERDAETFDVIVVGGGMSGLTASWYLRDRKVVCLERKDEAGGLAFRGFTPEGVAYGRGSAYYSKPRKHVERIYKELGMAPLEETAIPEPIDSYWTNGKLVEHVWEEEGLKQLPDGFRRFKAALLKVDEDGLVPEQPIDEAKELELDKITAAQWLKPFGPEVKDFLDSYCQSALGAKTDELNALAFCNFYLAEIETRYAWPGGTAGGSAHLIAILNKHNPAILRTGATVTRVRNAGAGVDVEYVHRGRRRVASAKYAIVTVPLRVAAWIVDGYPEERRRLVDRLTYADYIVHAVFTKRDYFTDSYDTWFANRSFTDVIVARWIETDGFEKKPSSGPGILSVYQPLAPHRGVKRLDPGTVADLGLAAIREVSEMVPELRQEPSLSVESYRWPASIHIVPPGYFSEWVPKLKDPVGRIYFAGNNLGTPSFEEALYRGWKAADDLRRLLSRAPARRGEPALAR
jgi:protoporphyrinogen oxidase